VKKLFIMLSIPYDFKEKFINFLKNVNSSNDNIIIIEDAYVEECILNPKGTIEKLNEDGVI
jgi:hypothetical protein